MYYKKNGKIGFDKTDQCLGCKNFKPRTTCPLLEALEQKVVSLAIPDVNVQNCSLFQKAFEIVRD